MGYPVDMEKMPSQSMGLGPIHQETTRTRLERQKKQLEFALADVNKAIGLLDANPQLEEFHEALRRV